MALQVAELSLKLIETLRPLVPRIKAKDKSLASSIALNIGEAELSDSGNRRARFFPAAGSAGETLTAVRVAIAWRYFAREAGEAAVVLLRRVIAILWKLTQG